MWHHEAFTRAFTSDRPEIIWPVTGHNAKIMRVLTTCNPLPCLCLFLFFCFVFIVTTVKEVWGSCLSFCRVTSEWTSFFSLSLSFLFLPRRKPPSYPRRFSPVLAPRIFSSPVFFNGLFLPARPIIDEELRFSYPWVAKGIRNWPSTFAYWALKGTASIGTEKGRNRFIALRALLRAAREKLCQWNQPFGDFASASLRNLERISVASVWVI